MDDSLRRQLRFSMILQASAFVMFTIAFVLRVVYSGLDLLALVFFVIAVAAGAFCVVLFRKTRRIPPSSK